MRALFTIILCGLHVLAVGGLSACQRASYPSGNLATLAHEQWSSVLKADSQVTALVVATRPTVPIREALPSAPRPHRHLVTNSAQASRKKHLKRLIVAPVSVANSLKVVERQVPSAPLPPDQSVHYRSRGIALLLAILSVTYLPLSLHNFYLGYYGRGAVAIGLLVLGMSLFLASFTGALFAGEALPLAYLGVAILGGWFLWQLSDLLRIISRDLKPKNGDYKQKFF
jgi:hypothetical protein